MIRLLHVVTLELKEFYDPKLYPAYAILSHRWKRRKEGGKLIDLEVSCEQLRDGSGCAEGLEKIRRACEAIREFPVEWIWIDSCCIDKNDAVEHTEAINSMYQWYAESYVCIAYLDDVDAFEDVRNSDWFRRGWTLQELIAPERLLFYNTYWQGCGSRNYYDPGLEQHTFQDKSFAISEITRIDVELLRLQDRKKIKRKLDSIPACQKMSWASNRTTTKEEDIAYCLIGIFNIPHMYLKRGEGKRAFIRLQEEIIKQSNDLTFFMIASGNCTSMPYAFRIQYWASSSVTTYHQGIFGAKIITC
ncbi:HET-domain-containing protein [Bimuria novae-zelandiae CBS 107.79]|uniref:HET-domain-containing protein n=1 Tax=Bimuria novae-zelandiae CBS 107.79 TaxID=1447943 RepID=A0A6A5VAN6_9PLEO|nr:HET-domain-containing protein [Bimuria novae-zelandiae CBS 107.79]